jgi:two-component system CheB/CheR fusion protein
MPAMHARSREESPLVLVADGDGEAGAGLARYLADRGFRATHTRLGAEVLDLAQTGQVGVVIVDVALRDMSGHALVARLKEIDPRLHILMTTGDFRPELELRARQIGILHYAQKPADPERLEAVVVKAIGLLRSA